MNIQETVDKFVESFTGGHNSTYFSGEHYVPSADRVVDFVRVDYETYDEDQKTWDEVKGDIRSLINLDLPDLISSVLTAYDHYTGSEIINVDLFHAVTFKRYVAGKKATSYAIYIALAVEW